MPLWVNVRQLEKKEAVLEGDLPIEDLEFAGLDECVEAPTPLRYALRAELMDQAILVQGRLTLELRCTCVRCLKVFTQRLDLRDWAAHLAREGEDAVPAVNDRVDLTPFLREDVLLEFPRHPLCDAGCKGLPSTPSSGVDRAGGSGGQAQGSAAWAELDKLKL